MLFHPDESQPEAVLSTTWSVVHAIFVAGAVLSLFGLAELYAYQAEGVGKMGLIGFVLAFIGVTLTISGLVLETFVVPVIAAEAPKLLTPSGSLLADPLGILFLLASASFALGVIMLGVTIVRAGVLPRFSALPMIVGAPLLAFWPPVPHLVGVIGGVLVGISFAWMGHALWSDTGTRIPRPRETEATAWQPRRRAAMAALLSGEVRPHTLTRTSMHKGRAPVGSRLLPHFPVCFGGRLVAKPPPTSRTPPRPSGGRAQVLIGHGHLQDPIRELES